MNPQNLKTPSHEKAVEIGRMGGLAAAKARREKADFLKMAKALMSCDIGEEGRKKIEHQYQELDPNDISYRTVILIKQLEKAVKGDINSAKFLIEATGEKPNDTITSEVKLPVLNIQVVENKELEKEFESYNEVK